MNKFGRNYQLAVEGDTGTILVTLPFTMEFDITRNVLSSANVCSIRVLNLGKTDRNSIRNNINDFALRTITLQAGYGSIMPLIFSGMINQAWSVREGVDWVSQIESLDAGFSYGTNNTQPIPVIPKGTKIVDEITTVISNLPGVQSGQVTIGAIGSNGTVSSKQHSHNKHPTEVLREIDPTRDFFIDLNKVYFLANNEYYYTPNVPTISSANGLLGTPQRESYTLHFDMLLEPSIRIGQIINLQSSTDTTVNGIYKVISLHHKGMISPAICGEAITTVGLFAPSLGGQTGYGGQLIQVGGPN